MDSIDSLPARIWLTGYDTDRRRLTERSWMDYLVRGAAVAELLHAGLLTGSRDGVMAPGGGLASDPVLAAAMPGIKPGTWQSWRHALRRTKPTYQALRAELAGTGTISPASWGRYRLNEPDAAVSTQRRLRRLIEDGGAARAADWRDCALTVMAAVVPLRTVAPRSSWRCGVSRVEAMRARVAREMPAFDDLVSQMRRTRRRAYSAGGPVH